MVEAEGWAVGTGMGSELCPLPRIFFSILYLKMASFGALWVPVGGCIPLILPLDPPLLLSCYSVVGYVQL